ncbi:MAG: hypothetical protein LBQ63_02415 [Deltaproteobacteria bacterium]|nr:hypothetical protein [Deltaproteobacteria bacterium]
MLKMLVGYTSEADNAELALAEVLERADIENKLLKNSVGLLFCNLDFIDSGVVNALCGRLPFKVIGCTTQGLATNDLSAQFMLSLVVLTSDTVEFSVGLSASLTVMGSSHLLRSEEEAEERLRALYTRTAASLAGRPSMMLVFQPLLLNLPGDAVTSVLDRVSEGVPIFGSIALDMPTKIRSPQIIHNGLPYADRLTILLLSEAASPRFFLKTISPQNSRSAIITRAEGNKLLSINNMPAIKHLEKLGIAEQGRFSPALFFMATIRSPGGRTSTCVFYDVTPEGHLICGNTPETGGILEMGAITGRNVLESAAELIEEIRTACFEEESFRNALLFFACFSRSLDLMDATEESEFIRKELQSTVFPYVFAYSGGEFCPVTENGRLENRFQQHSIIACLL